LSDNKSPYVVDWAITAKCNLKCRHCRGMFTGELSTERAKKLIAEIAVLKPGWVIVEGGEPLLRADLFELLKLMRQSQLETHLITNGMLLNPEIITTLKKLGVRVMISIDGATKATFEAIRGGANFETVIKSAENCAKAGILEAINFTILKTNYTEIPQFFKLAASIGTKKITFIGLKRCQDYLKELLSPEEYKEAIKLTCEAAQRTGIEFFFDEPFFWATVKELGFLAHMPASGAGILAPATTACIFGEYIFIEPNGEVKPCSFAPITVGNVSVESLDKIWHEMLVSPLLNQIRDPKTRTGSCQACQYLVECKGCRSRTYVLTGDWFAADPVCPLGLKLAVKEES